SVERRAETELRLVPQDAQPWIRDRGEQLGRCVGRAVVDDEEFEVGDGLAEDAVDSDGDVRLGVVRREHDRDEWRRRRTHGARSRRTGTPNSRTRVLASRGCRRRAFRPSTLSSRPWAEPPSWRRYSPPWSGRPTTASASSLPTRTRTTAWSRRSPGGR